MNIFAPYACPVKSAQSLDNLRVPKMILESAQLLSTVAYLADHPEKLVFYKPGWQRHPCTLWLMESQANVSWLLRHAEALCAEFHRRFSGNSHDSEWIFEYFKEYVLKTDVFSVPDVPLTPHANCTEFKSEPDVHLAYQKALIAKWDAQSSRPIWGKTGCPDFWYEHLLSSGRILLNGDSHARH
jgi:hypothetical protein